MPDGMAAVLPGPVVGGLVATDDRVFAAYRGELAGPVAWLRSWQYRSAGLAHAVV